MSSQTHDDSNPYGGYNCAAVQAATLQWPTVHTTAPKNVRVYVYKVKVQRYATLVSSFYCKITLRVSGTFRTNHQEYKDTLTPPTARPNSTASARTQLRSVAKHRTITAHSQSDYSARNSMSYFIRLCSFNLYRIRQILKPINNFYECKPMNNRLKTNPHRTAPSNTTTLLYSV
jgi:hypothetical protein